MNQEHLVNNMKIIKSLNELRAWRSEAIKNGQTVAFVPTMGNLHDGHISLVDIAKHNANLVVSSIFVNPMQFAAHEDLDAYPRTFEQDCNKLQQAGCDLLYFPSVDDMYPNGLAQQTAVEVPEDEYSLIAEAAQRPGHFRGVSTVVTKLFNMVQPDVAVFGEKDYQQLRVIKNMVRDLNMPVDIIAGPTIRETSGLARSSRNGYLTSEQLAVAPALNMAINAIKQAMLEGNKDTNLLSELGKELISEAGLKPDYIEIRHAETLAPVDKDTNKIVILAAAYLGKARLIDNESFTL
jgi:pantoate--beta-alanine ligase